MVAAASCFTADLASCSHIDMLDLREYVQLLVGSPAEISDKSCFYRLKILSHACTDVIYFSKFGVCSPSCSTDHNRVDQHRNGDARTPENPAEHVHVKQQYSAASTTDTGFSSFGLPKQSGLRM